MTTTATTRDTALDGLRGLAAMAVVFSHMAAMTWNPYHDQVDSGTAWEKALWHLGAPAVDIFLVLSGYVVTQAILRSRPGYVDFVIGRMVRLYPIAWIGVLAGLLLRHAGLDFPPGASQAVALLRERLETGDVLGLTTMIAPIPSANRVDPPLWSLVVEMQATLAMPLIARLAARDGRMLAALSLCVPVLAALLTMNTYPYFFTGFGVGGALAVLERRVPSAPRPAAVLLFFIALLACRHYFDSEDASLRVPCAIAAAGIVLAIRQGAGRRILESRFCNWLGSVSYPLYAVHWPIMAAVCMTLGWRIGVTAAAAASIPLALLVATMLERVVDRPATTLSRLLRRR